MSKKYLLFTDGDLDGVGCAILAKLAFGEDNVEILYGREINKYIEDILDMVDYNLGYENIFIADTSINEENAKRIDELENNNFLLFDHHKTADWLNKYTWANIKHKTIDVIEKPVKKSISYDISATRVFFDYLKHNRLITRVNNIITKFVSLVSDYDTWNWASNGNREAKWLNDLFFFYGRDRFIKRIIKKINFSGEDSFILSYEDKELLCILQEQEENYVKNHMKKENLWFVTAPYNNKEITFVTTFAESHISSLGHALAEKYKLTCGGAAIITPRGTIEFRGVKDDVDISEFAKFKNGGGHAKACGCPIEEKSIMSYIMDAFKTSKVESVRYSI